MEIIVFPYMAVSFLIGWAIFSPFTSIEDLDEWSFAKFGIPEMLAVFLPFSLFLALTVWAVPREYLTPLVMILVVATTSVIAFLSLLAGLYVVPKLKEASASKRIAMIGIVIPVGFMLTIAWIVVPTYAFAISAMYSIPATITVALKTLVLRGMSLWICRGNALASK